MTQVNCSLMHDIENRYRERTGLHDRRYYSLFYGPLAPFPLVLINENPGGSADNYQIVKVDDGEHEYVEGRHSGRTTLRGSELLRRLLGADDFEPVRRVQVFNRIFRRSPNVGAFTAAQKNAYVEEARPFLLECLGHVAPRLIVFGGTNSAVPFMNGLGGRAIPEDSSAIMGPNGSNDAAYYREYALSHPMLGELPGIGIYHPSRINSVFYDKVFPRLKWRVGQIL